MVVLLDMWGSLQVAQPIACVQCCCLEVSMLATSIQLHQAPTDNTYTLSDSQTTTIDI